MDPTLAFVSGAFGLPRAHARAFVTGSRPIAPVAMPARAAALVVRATAAGEAPPQGDTPSADAAPQETASKPAEAAAKAPVAQAPGAVAPIEATPAATAAAAESAPADAAAAPAAPADDDGAEKKRRNRRVGGSRQKREVTLKLEDMTVGQEIEGVVKSTTTYGAFIGDMGTPTDGLLHVSQLADGYVEKVTDLVAVGQKVKVRVLSVDLEKGNFSLTMKPPRTAEQEAADAERRSGGGSRGGGGGGGGSSGSKWKDFKYDPQVFIDVKVVSVAGFGAFCKLLDSEGKDDESVPTDGLIHISELSDEHVSDVSSVLSVGQVVKARVTDTDRKRNRISLSLKQHKQSESAAFAEDMEASRSKQPTFRTTMELAFERAKKKQ